MRDRKESKRSDTSSRNSNYTPAKEVASLDGSPLNLQETSSESVFSLGFVFVLPLCLRKDQGKKKPTVAQVKPLCQQKK